MRVLVEYWALVAKGNHSPLAPCTTGVLDTGVLAIFVCGYTSQSSYSRNYVDGCKNRENKLTELWMYVA